MDLAVGSRAVWFRDSLRVLREPCRLRAGQVLVPYPDFLRLLADAFPERCRFEPDSLRFLVLPPRPWITEVATREVGHRFEVRLANVPETEPDAHWDGLGTLRVRLPGRWPAPGWGPLPAGDLVEEARVLPRAGGTEVLLRLDRSVKAWNPVFRAGDSTLVLALTQSGREASGKGWRPLRYLPLPRGKNAREVLLVVEAPAAGRRTKDFLRRLTNELLRSLERRLPGWRVRLLETDPAERAEDLVARANGARAAVLLVLAVGPAGEAGANGLLLEVPAKRWWPPSALAEADSLFLPWELAGQRHLAATRYLRDLLLALLADAFPVQEMTRPMPRYLGLDLPWVRLRVGRLTPAWESTGDFPAEADWAGLGRLADLVSLAVQEFLAGREEG
jgi:hypothetical protein